MNSSRLAWRRGCHQQLIQLTPGITTASLQMERLQALGDFIAQCSCRNPQASVPGLGFAVSGSVAIGIGAGFVDSTSSGSDLPGASAVISALAGASVAATGVSEDALGSAGVTSSQIRQEQFRSFPQELWGVRVSAV